MMNDIEREELNRILDLPNANRVPTSNDIAFLKARIEYLSGDQIRQFGLLEIKVGASEPVVPIKVKKSAKVKKSPKIATKKAVKVVKVVKKAKK